MDRPASMRLNTVCGSVSFIFPCRRHAEHPSTEWPAPCAAPEICTREWGLKLILWLWMLIEKTKSTPRSGTRNFDALLL